MDRINILQSLARPAVVTDLYHEISMGFTLTDFDISLYETIGDILGISEFMELRIKTAKGSLVPDE